MRQFVEGCRRQNLQAINTGYPLVIQPIAIAIQSPLFMFFPVKPPFMRDFPLPYIYMIYN
jgi:hypothetical protein